MKTYRFTSGTSKSDMTMGLGIPAAIVIPMLITYLILFYSGVGVFAEYKSLAFLVLLPGLFITYLLIKKMLKSIKKDYVVKLDGVNIEVFENGREVVSGQVSYCEIKEAHDKLVRVDMYSDADKISFRARPKEYKAITGFTSFNPFGTSSLTDMDNLLALGMEIESVVEDRK